MMCLKKDQTILKLSKQNKGNKKINGFDKGQGTLF